MSSTTTTTTRIIGTTTLCHIFHTRLFLLVSAIMISSTARAFSGAAIRAHSIVGARSISSTFSSRAVTMWDRPSFGSCVATTTPMSRSSISSSSTTTTTTTRYMSNDGTNDDTSIVDLCQSKIAAHFELPLDGDAVTVTGAYDDPNGSHISIQVISDQFEGKRAVQRQQMVYKAIWEELQGPVHAVDAMVCQTPSEARSTTSTTS